MSPLPKKALILTLTLLVLASAAVAQTAGQECTKETLADCYQGALQQYQNREYAKAKSLLEQIIAIDAEYKKAAATLKKCYAKLAEGTIAKEREAQRLTETKRKEEEKAKKEQELEMKKLEEAEAKQKEMDILAERKDEMVEDGRIPEPEMRQPPSDGLYRIGVGDVLEISVWRVSDLDKIVIVRPDGVISYPLVGDVSAAGLTLTELDENLTAALRDFVRAPEVSVAIQRFGGTKVIILGEIKSPGVYSIPGGGGVIDVVALAGGFTNDAVRHKSFLVRGGLKQPEVFALNLARIFKGDLSQNIPLASNDIVYVPRKVVASFNYVITQITPLLSNTLLGTTVYRDLKTMP